MSKFNLRHTAHLARLHFKDEELSIFESQIENILGFVDQLKAVDVTGVEPTSHPMALSNVFRDDKVIPSLSIATFLEKSPKARGAFFEVPKVIEDNP